jgi:hypothetical protein
VFESEIELGELLALHPAHGEDETAEFPCTSKLKISRENGDSSSTSSGIYSKCVESLSDFILSLAFWNEMEFQRTTMVF